MGCTIKYCEVCGYEVGLPRTQVCTAHSGKFGKCKNELGEFEKADAFFNSFGITLCKPCANQITEAILEANAETRGGKNGL
jgi:hypothetical protein